MNKLIAASLVLGAALLLFGGMAPGLKRGEGPNIMEGTLEDQNENVAVIRSRDGREHLFWLPEGFSCPAENGDLVRAAYEGRGKGQKKVLSLLSLIKL